MGRGRSLLVPSIRVTEGGGAIAAIRRSVHSGRGGRLLLMRLLRLLPSRLIAAMIDRLLTIADPLLHCNWYSVRRGL